MGKIDIFKKVKQLNFANDVHPILHLIEKNLDRVEFVKDHIGLKDFVFLAEREATKFEFPYFACFNLDIKENDDAHNFVSMNQSLIYDLKEIYKDLNYFFENNDSILYIEIGFKESVPSQEDRFRVYQLLKTKEVNDIQEAISKVRKFPTWYQARFSKEVQDSILLFSQLETLDRRLLKKLKRDLITELDDSLKKNDQERFTVLSERYKKVCKEMV